MTSPSLASLANEAIIAMTGPEAFARGMVYARDGRVSGLEFDAENLTVAGRVRGSNRSSYATSVQLAGGPHGSATTHRGRCSCPMALDCKHAAAVLIAARAMEQVTRQLNRSEWERVMARLANAPEPVAAADLARLGLEFNLERTPGYRGAPGLLTLGMRPVRLGARGKWVRTGVSWDDLEYASSGVRPEQHELLLQLRAAAGSAARFTYPRTPWLSLSSVSPGVWAALGRSADAGLDLVAPAEVNALQLHDQRATVALDVRRDVTEGLDIQAQVLLGERPVQTDRVGTLGDPGHGVFWLSAEGRERTLNLARLTRPVSGELRQMLNRSSHVYIPLSDEEHFRDDYLPQLRSKAAFVSSDDSVAIPEPPQPILHCTVTFRPPDEGVNTHRVRVDWAVSYPASSGPRVFAVDEPLTRPSMRNAAAERDLLSALSLPYDRLPLLAAPGPDRRPVAHALFAGRDAVVFVSEILPGLADQGVRVTVVGEPVDYRQVHSPPDVELSTTADPDAADWFDLHIKVSVEGEVVNFEQLFVALAQGEEFLILDSGVCIALDRPQLKVLRDLITEARTLRDDDRPGQRISTFQASLWEELIQLGVVIEQSDQWAKTVNGLLNVTEIEPVEPPATLRATLRAYQLEGYRWLAFLYDHGLGGILADDMGLGKTVQALAQVCRARLLHPDDPPFLVVAPTSVVSNWAREAERFAPSLKVVAIEATRARHKTDLASVIAGADLVVTSYALLRIDIESYAAPAWRGLILDEAQFVKNHRAKTYQCARRIRAPFKLAITGTPLENSLMDLWALLSITAPGLFPHPERFSEFYRQPIERGHDADVLARLRRRIRPLMLRRTKENVAGDLPPKQEQVVEVVLQPRHQRVYQTHLQRERQKILGLVEDLDKNRFTILRSLTLLRQLALDPSLVDAAHSSVPASKIDLLVEQLDELVSEGHRALVFSQFTGFLTKIKHRLDAGKISYSYLDGRTRSRGQVIEQFKAGATSVFLISLKAGGFGLNLTEADYCFVLDPWWNPAAEAQAVDRTHRIGQAKTVMVYRLVAKDTIEEKVMELKARKEKLFDAVLGGDALADTSLTAEEIRALVAG